MRPVRVIAAVTLAAAAVAAGSYLALSTSSDRGATPAAPAAAPPADRAVDAPTTVAGTTDGDAAALADGRHPVLLETIDAGRGTVTFDLVQYFRDEEAASEAAKDHQESPPPNDTYMRNVNPRLRTLPVRSDAAVSANQLAGSNQDVPVSLARLGSLAPAGSGVFWITVRDGQIVRISQQWSP